MFEALRLKFQYAGLKCLSPFYGVRVNVKEGTTHTVDLKKLRHSEQRSIAIKLKEQQVSVKYDPAPAITAVADQSLLIPFTEKVKDPHFMHRYKKSAYQRHKTALQMFSLIRKNPSYRKVDASLRCPNQPTQAQRKAIWKNAPIAEGFNPDSFRLDVLGGLVCKRHNKPESAGPLAYDIEHIFPRSHGGLTVTENLCLLNADVNRFKQDAHIFMCGLPAIYSRVQEMSVDPAKVRRTFRSWNGKQKVKERWSLDLERKPDGLLDWVDV